jgi:deazaflavin-dependent oxidoreductase (nitroreductase family)
MDGTGRSSPGAEEAGAAISSAAEAGASGDIAAVTDTSADSGQWGTTDRAMRRVFGVLNRYWWVPIMRSGLGPLFATPIGGYIMLLRTTGRKSGKKRYAPLDYAIIDGAVYCLAGFGTGTHWYRNIGADPRVEVILPGGSFAGVAEKVTDDAERVRALRQVGIAGGIPGFGLGVNPRTASDEALREHGATVPVVRIRPTGIGSGPADPGGWMWIVAQGAMALVTVGWLARRLRRRG